MPPAPNGAHTWANRDDAIESMRRDGWRLFDAVPASLFTIALKGRSRPMMLECDSTRSGMRRWWWRIMKELP